MAGVDKQDFLASTTKPPQATQIHVTRRVIGESNAAMAVLLRSESDTCIHVYTP